MANSLMELYGGGMTQPVTNYQIGGAVSKAKIRSAQLGDWARSKDAYLANIGEIGKLSTWGSILQTLMDMVVPGSGGLGKAAVESFYTPEEPEGLEFGLETAKKYKDVSDAWKKGTFERGLASSVSSLMLSDVYKDLGEKAKAGLGNIKENIPVEIFGEQAAREYGIGSKGFAENVRERAFADPSMPWLTEDWQTSLGDTDNLWDFLPEAKSVSSVAPYTKAIKRGPPIPKADLVRMYGPDYWMYQKRGGLIDAEIPQYQYGGIMDKNQLQPEFQYQSNMGELPWKGERSMWSRDLTGNDLDDFDDEGEGTPPTTTTPPPERTPGAAGTYDPAGTYGMQRDVFSALTSAGMGEKMLDPEFAKYGKYLPTWAMGYGQKVGGYRTGAQENLMSYVQPQGAAGQTFKSAGEAERLRQLGRTQTTEQFRTQERGVGEEYTKDVLAALTAAETAREKPFEAPEAGDKVDPPNPPDRRDILYQTKEHNGRKWQWNGYEWEDMGPAGG